MLMMNYWLLKSEPSVYSIMDLARDKSTLWDGVRNYQARNFLRLMVPGDLAFFYHSNTKSPGIVGLVQIKETNLADPSQFDLNSPYYDPKATPEKPRWWTVKVEYVETFPQLISLDTLKAKFTGEQFAVVKKGNRLSVVPVPGEVATAIVTLTALGW